MTVKFESNSRVRNSGFSLVGGGDKTFQFCKEILPNCRVSCDFYFACIPTQAYPGVPQSTSLMFPTTFISSDAQTFPWCQQQFCCTHNQEERLQSWTFTHLWGSIRKLHVGSFFFFRRETTSLQITRSFSATMQQESNSRKEEYLWRACAQPTCST